MTKRKRGRPTLPPYARRTARVQVRLTQQEYLVIAGKAAIAGQQVSSYLRLVGLQGNAA